MSESNPNPTAPRVITIKESRLTLPDLLDDLLWPKLFRAAPLALQPGRIGLALFTLAVAGLIGIANTWWSDAPSFFELIAATLNAPPVRTPGAIANPITDALARAGHLVTEHPLALLFQGVPILAALAIGTAAIARMVAVEFSAGVTMSWTEALGFVLSRWPSALGAAFGAPLLIGLIALALAALGFIFLQLPGLDILGAIGFIVVLLLALLGAALTLGLLLGHSMLVPALACEGTDAIDALQRVYAYVLAKPGRLVAYSLVLGAILAVTAGATLAIAGATDFLARNATGAWLGDAASTILHPHAIDASAEPPAATRSIASRIINVWLGLVWMIAVSSIFATYVSGSTILYLIMRQASDGQDWGELWFPEHAAAGRDELSPNTNMDRSARAISASARSETTE